MSDPQISVRLNDEPVTYPAGTTCRDVIAEILCREVADDGRTPEGGVLPVAIALDDAVVPRSQWASTPLPDGTRVEIVSAVQGG